MMVVCVHLCNIMMKLKLIAARLWRFDAMGCFCHSPAKRTIQFERSSDILIIPRWEDRYAKNPIYRIPGHRRFEIRWSRTDCQRRLPRTSKVLLKKKAFKTAVKREFVIYLTTQFTMNIRQACRTLSLSRTVYCYQPDTRRDEPVIQALTDMAERYLRYGFNKSFQKLCRQGCAGNHTRVHRIYCLLKLNFRRKGKQRFPVRYPAPLATPEHLNYASSNFKK